MRIGVVDLDTSHPQNWIPIERELGHDVVGVYDGGAVHPPDYAIGFARDHGISRVYAALEEMAADVDAAIVHSCNWDVHVARCRPFVEAGKAVLIDKPIAGNLRDIGTFREWARAGARITGGSSLRFCAEARDWLAERLDVRGAPHTAMCGCAVDEFNYGIHAYSLLSAILGLGIESVQHICEGPQHRVLIRWRDGSIGLVVVGAAAAYHPFHATVVTDRSVAHFQPDPGRLYRALLELALPYLAGDAPAPVPFDELIEPELAAIAARQSRESGGSEIALADMGDSGYDGAAFAESYRRTRYPSLR